jgi:hypothetical protein
VAQVEFVEWTAGIFGIRFIGLREDQCAADVTRE